MRSYYMQLWGHMIDLCICRHPVANDEDHACIVDEKDNG